MVHTPVQESLKIKLGGCILSFDSRLAKTVVKTQGSSLVFCFYLFSMGRNPFIPQTGIFSGAKKRMSAGGQLRFNSTGNYNALKVVKLHRPE